MQCSQLASVVKGQLIGQDVDFQEFSTDSRTLKPGELFIALTGESHNGHAYLTQAISQGAAAVLVSEAQADLTLPQIVVPDTLAALGTWAAWHRQQMPDLTVIAVTGSCGKTTTKQMMASIVAQVGPTHFSQGSFNNHFGVPFTLLALTPAHRYAVIEMGANHAHEIAPLTQMAQPDVAIVTNVAPVHIEGFGDLNTIAQTKGEVYDGLHVNGTAIVNADDAFYPLWQDKLGQQPCLTFALDKPADVTATAITLQQGCAQFTLQTPVGNTLIQLPILGQHNVMNALAAASAALALQVPLTAIAQGLQTMTPGKHRLHICQGLHQAKIIDDAYNANPLAVKAALDILASESGEKVWVFSDMGELGELASHAHEEVGVFAKQKGIDTVFAVGELTPLTVQAFGDGGQHFQDKQSLIQALQAKMHGNMTILVKGSRSGKLEEVVAAISAT